MPLSLHTSVSVCVLTHSFVELWGCIMLYSVQQSLDRACDRETGLILFPVVLDNWPIGQNVPCFSEGKGNYFH